LARIGILGLGNWGTALARVWLGEGHSVHGWTIEDEVYASLMESSINEKYLPGVVLDGLNATMRLEDVTDESEIIVLALPSGVILRVVDDLIPHLRPSHVLLDLAKGLAPEDEESPQISAAIERRLRAAGRSNPVIVLTGPTIAPEVASGVMTTAVVASDDAGIAERLADRLTTETLVLSPASDPKGAELWGAYKNTVALACGLVDGLAGSLGGDNLKAALFAAGFSEGRLLLSAMGVDDSTAFGPAGLGDMFVTATSPSSRNRTLGEKLGSGKSLETALAEMHMVAEGVRAARMFRDRAEALGVDTPFLEALCGLLDGDIDVGTAVRAMVETLGHR